uniref:Uncharacterized protein n=1 Tax=Kalanchoe fedtschenkoi TaxID=63787 RepID=A0A7N1A6D7_KALFE
MGFMATCSAFGVLLLILRLSKAQPSPQQVYNYHSCAEASESFQTASVFATNLDQVLAHFSSLNQTNNGFFNLSDSTRTKSTQWPFAGETSARALVSSVSGSGPVISPRRCPGRMEGIVFYDECMFRYTNWYIFRSVERTYATLSNHSYSNGMALYGYRLFSLLEALRDEASSGNSTLKLAVGDTELAGSERIYALAQCVPDLDQMQCENCLDRAFGDITRNIPGKGGGRVLGASCSLWFDTTRFYGVQVDSPAPPPEGTRKRNIVVVIAVVSALVVSLMLLASYCVWRIRSRARPVENGDEVKRGELQVQFETIGAATGDFSEENKLGQGGFGAVYKVERLSLVQIYLLVSDRIIGSDTTLILDCIPHSELGRLADGREIAHKNLVRLLSFCLQGSERLLIYEYVPNASLDKFLFITTDRAFVINYAYSDHLADPDKRALLSWETRYKIIKGVARGLLYLHEDSRLRIIHRDLKTSNVLLDEEMNPKISDFGMARLFAMDQTRGQTTRIVSTYGYMAPEYAIHGQFSAKSDVYSFGVMIMELITGCRISSFDVGGASEHLLSFAWESWTSGRISDIFDATLLDCRRDEILRSIHIGLLCVQESVKARPTMASVSLMLGSVSLSLPLPSRPAYFTPNMMSSSETGGSENIIVEERDTGRGTQKDTRLRTLTSKSLSRQQPDEGIWGSETKQQYTNQATRT